MAQKSYSGVAPELADTGFPAEVEMGQVEGDCTGQGCSSYLPLKSAEAMGRFVA